MIHPALADFFELLAREQAFLDLTRALRSSEPADLTLGGLNATSQAIYAALLHKRTDRPVLLITESNPMADLLCETASSIFELLDDNKGLRAGPLVLPALDVSPYDGLSPHAEIAEKRGLALWRMASGSASVVVAPAAAALLKTAPAEQFRNLAWTIEIGDEFFLEDLEQGLASVGYVRNEPVEMAGQFSVRGGILDVFPPEAPAPLRIELLGDEVESIREFDPETQKSIQRVDQALLAPLSEHPVSRELGVADDEGLRPGWEFQLRHADKRRTSVLDLMKDPIVLWAEPGTLAEHAEKVFDRLEEKRPDGGVPVQTYFWTWEQLRNQSKKLDTVDCKQLGEDGSLDVRAARMTRFQGNVAHAVGELKALTSAGSRALVCAASLGDLERLADIFGEYGVSYQLGARPEAGKLSPFLEEKATVSGALAAAVLVVAPIREGVVFPDAKAVLVGSEDIFAGSDLVAQPSRSKSTASTFLSGLEDLKPGDLVVHSEHGVGRYLGMTAVQQGSRQEELMQIEYAERAKLYVPLSRLDLVQKYHGAGGRPPTLDRMGGQTWTRTKSKVKARLLDMADELLKLYAKRKMAKGFAYSPDGEWQREFEDSFKYQPTKDQRSSVKDVKRDMESSLAMDRLICGDVGFGKTEVAMRAAMKALGDGKQVAVLAPTTVLSFQHYETFRQRFASFPVMIEMLNRFRPPKEQKAIVEKVGLGEVDLLIGTHRILSKDVEFADLGLLIVDEEQRFGVRHKERLKQMRANVDVLTLSATPIPRTLHMSLVGLRDISIIQTPPKDRLSIQTVVAPANDALIQRALELELGRKGQVYFIHNRVESIWSVAARLQQLAPEARIVVGHGQMGEKELERVMLKFMNHEADILVATTIIENGLDIPLANTIVVDRADMHGLSELYQLRGRVGRSNRRAYAYLLIPEDKELSDIARKRLAALKEFSELGSGFKIAALDLELRGAGNLLGGEQSGQIGAIGFEAYCRLLEDTVKELRGEVVEEAVRTTLRLQIDIHIPTDYIADESQRLRAYKKLADIANAEDREQAESELRDRYGPPPQSVVNLMEYARLKTLAEAVRVEAIERRQTRLTVRFREDSKVDPTRLMQFVSNASKISFSPTGELVWHDVPSDAGQLLAATMELLERVAA